MIHESRWVIAKNYIKAHPYPKKTVAQAENIIILPIVTRIKPELLEPDNMIIEKLQKGTALFLIAKGECMLDFRHGNFHKQHTSQLWRRVSDS